MNDVQTLEQLIKYSFKNQPSVAKWVLAGSGHEPFEYLEFLGDHILGGAASRYVTLRKLTKDPTLPDEPIAALYEQLIHTLTLQKIGEQLGIQRFVKTDKKSNKYPKAVADILEAIIGAIDLDGGSSASEAFVDRVILTQAQTLFEDIRTINWKNKLKTETSHRFGKEPTYRNERVKGGEVFRAEVFIGKKILGAGSGRSPQSAEKMAAHAAYLKLISQDSKQ